LRSGLGYPLGVEDLTPRQVVAYLDRFIVSQSEAKRAVAVAIRNRIRRQRLDEGMRKDILPKNIILAGPTGVGKTEIARRMAALIKAPFLKVEATKYTEVGYFGRDVDTIARDLVEIGVALVKAEEKERVRERAREAAEERLLDILQGEAAFTTDDAEREQRRQRREELRARLRKGDFDKERITLAIEGRSAGSLDVYGAMGVEQMGMDMEAFLDRVAPPRLQQRTMPVARAREALEAREGDRMLDKEAVTAEAIRRVEETGIVFLDELDKIVGVGTTQGPDVSRGGVQRDLLPLVEGCTVQTRYGPVRTDHVLFIGAGAFHNARPEDLIPELQGRFPLRVTLEPLKSGDFERILTEPEHSLVKQYKALLKVDGVDLDFTPDGVEEIAALAQRLNTEKSDIGARRLHMVLERLLEPVAFGAPEEKGRVRVDAPFVLQRVEMVSNP
ncbi:MAG TPA: ATP-dependent protease ATPase subunit HslU, partial [Candidatus Eisenbacteria bacterium]|nr:ATP-dependent protease ATPase subunit HslU [Candidatus Eisenbacteria bacterium]